MTTFSDYKHIHENLGITVPNLGCVMLKLHVDSKFNLAIDPKELHVSPHPERWWINGDVTDSLHITLKYGLLNKAWRWEDHIRELLDGWEPEPVELAGVKFFDSPYSDEPYACMVGVAKVTENLMEAHRRLSYLPHIDTFTPYVPHVTLAYLNSDVHGYDFAGIKLEAGELDLGER